MNESIEQLSSDIGSASDEIEEINTSLRDQREWLETAKEEWIDRNEEEKEAFRDSADELFSVFEKEDIGLEDFRSALDELRQTLNNPVLDSINAIIRSIADHFDIDLEEFDLSRDEIRSRFEEDYTSTRNKYRQIETAVQDLDAVPKQRVANDYRDDPYLLYKPDRLSKDISNFSESYEALEKAIEYLGGMEWAPDSIDDILDDSEWLSKETPPLEQIETEAEAIDTHLSNLTEYGLSPYPAVRSSFEQELNDNIGDLIDSLNSIREKTTEIQEYESSITTTFRLKEEYPEHAAEHGLADTWEGKVAQSHSSVEGLLNDLRSLKEEVEEWQTELRSDWRQIHNASNFYLNNIEDLEATLPDDVSDTFDDGFNVEEYPVESYELLLEARSWLSQQEKELVEEMGEDAVNLLNDLIENDNISADKYPQSAVSEIASHIDLRLYIADE